MKKRYAGRAVFIYRGERGGKGTAWAEASWFRGDSCEVAHTSIPYFNAGRGLCLSDSTFLLPKKRKWELLLLMCPGPTDTKVRISCLGLRPEVSKSANNPVFSQKSYTKVQVDKDSMSTPNRPRVLNSANGTPARRTGLPPRTPAVAQTPRTSIRDQIKALRQAQATPQASSSTPRARARRDAVRELVRHSADTGAFAGLRRAALPSRSLGASDEERLRLTLRLSRIAGRLVIPAHMEGSEGPALEHIPLAMYTLLLGIPPDELSRKPPKPTKAPLSPFPGSRSSSSMLAQGMDALSLGKEDVFGEEQEDEQVGGFIGGRDLEVLKVGGQALTELDLELGLFGGLKALDVRSLYQICSYPRLLCVRVLTMGPGVQQVRDNRLTSLPSSFPHLGQLTTLNLSYVLRSASTHSVVTLYCEMNTAHITLLFLGTITSRPSLRSSPSCRLSHTSTCPTTRSPRSISPCPLVRPCFPTPSRVHRPPRVCRIDRSRLCGR